MTRPTKQEVRVHDEVGASLILALIFIVVTSVIMLSLTSLATNGLNSVAQFRIPQLDRTALDSAMSTAIYQERYVVTQASISTTGATALCSSPVVQEPGMSAQSGTFQIWCSTAQDNVSNTQTRTVTFSACPYNYTGAICPTPLLVAKVNFDDYPYIGSPLLLPPPGAGSFCTTYCGTAETIISWVLQTEQ